MKKILLILAIATVFDACKSKTNSDKNIAPLADPYNVSSDTARNVKKPLKDSVVTTTTVTVTKTPVDQKDVPKTIHHSSKTTAPKSTVKTNGVNTQTAVSPTTTQTKKKGWSKAAKGTAIGAGAGAVTGAVIGRNVKGAVIGTAVGAAGGYIIGRAQDRKDGRVKKDSL